MTYRDTAKRLKIRSDQGVAAKAALRLERGERLPLIDLDPYLKITVERRATGEKAVFECYE